LIGDLRTVRLEFWKQRVHRTAVNLDRVKVLQVERNSVAFSDADTTSRNPNVFYEVGYAHALKIPTILICREGAEIPFDVKAVNHIIYASIVDLRERLERRLRSMLNDGESSAGNPGR
jgi:hypothetical protein